MITGFQTLGTASQIGMMLIRMLKRGFGIQIGWKLDVRMERLMMVMVERVFV